MRHITHQPQNLAVVRASPVVETAREALENAATMHESAHCGRRRHARRLRERSRHDTRPILSVERRPPLNEARVEAANFMWGHVWVTALAETPPPGGGIYPSI